MSGARGPYRATPNFMVVVPTSTEVRLTYDRSAVEWFSMAVTLVGLGAAAWLVLRPRGRAGSERFARIGARRRAKPRPERPVSAANRNGSHPAPEAGTDDAGTAREATAP